MYLLRANNTNSPEKDIIPVPRTFFEKKHGIEISAIQFMILNRFAINNVNQLISLLEPEERSTYLDVISRIGEDDRQVEDTYDAIVSLIEIMVNKQVLILMDDIKYWQYDYSSDMKRAIIKASFVNREKIFYQGETYDYTESLKIIGYQKIHYLLLIEAIIAVNPEYEDILIFQNLKSSTFSKIKPMIYKEFVHFVSQLMEESGFYDSMMDQIYVSLIISPPDEVIRYVNQIFEDSDNDPYIQNAIFLLGEYIQEFTDSPKMIKSIRTLISSLKLPEDVSQELELFFPK